MEDEEDCGTVAECKIEWREGVEKVLGLGDGSRLRCDVDVEDGEIVSSLSSSSSSPSSIPCPCSKLPIPRSGKVFIASSFSSCRTNASVLADVGCTATALRLLLLGPRGTERSRGSCLSSRAGARSMAAKREESQRTKVSILWQERRNCSVSARRRITYFLLYTLY